MSKTVTITGAAGQIGYQLAFRIASGQLLGRGEKINLNLLEITPALDALKGVAMELEDCAFAWRFRYYYLAFFDLFEIKRNKFRQYQLFLCIQEYP